MSLRSLLRLNKIQVTVCLQQLLLLKSLSGTLRQFLMCKEKCHLLSKPVLDKFIIPNLSEVET